VGKYRRGASRLLEWTEADWMKEGDRERIESGEERAKEVELK